MAGIETLPEIGNVLDVSADTLLGREPGQMSRGAVRRRRPGSPRAAWQLTNRRSRGTVSRSEQLVAMADTIHTEFCVVGAGPAGAVLASALARDGKKVLLLEQGPSYGPEARTAILEERSRRLLDMFSLDIGDQWTPDFDNARVTSIGKTPWDYLSVAGVGGTSLHWAASTPRPIEDDMRVRTRFGHGRDWPISYAELEPWLLRAEHEIGVAANADNPYASPRSGDFPMPAPPFSHFERAIFAPAAQKLGWTAHSRPNAINSVARDGRPA